MFPPLPPALPPFGIPLLHPLSPPYNPPWHHFFLFGYLSAYRPSVPIVVLNCIYVLELYRVCGRGVPVRTRGGGQRPGLGMAADGWRHSVVGWRGGGSRHWWPRPGSSPCWRRNPSGGVADGGKEPFGGEGSHAVSGWFRGIGGTDRHQGPWGGLIGAALGGFRPLDARSWLPLLVESAETGRERLFLPS